MTALSLRSPREVLRRRAGRLVAVAVPLLTLGVGTAVSAAPVGAASLDSAPIARTVVPVAESWYRPLSPTCATPVGCPPVEPPPGYPDGTLHVGVLGGAPDSTTQIALPLPTSGLVGGTLRLPVEPIADGTLQPEMAKVKACVVTGNVKDKIAGSISNRPGVDCATATSPAVPTSDGTALTIDLTPFIGQWEGSEAGSLAIVPAEDAPAQTEVWHVAFSRHDRAAAGSHPLTASLLVQDATEPTTPEVDIPDVSAPDGLDSSDPLVAEQPSLGQVSPGVMPGLAQQPVPTVAGPSTVGAAPRTLRPVAAILPDTSFAYPGVFLLPLLGLLATGWLVRAFTRDLTDAQR